METIPRNCLATLILCWCNRSTVLAQTGRYHDATSIEKSTCDFEGMIYSTCGSSYVDYKKQIEDKLAKIRSAFIPPDFDARRQHYVKVSPDLTKKSRRNCGRGVFLGAFDHIVIGLL